MGRSWGQMNLRTEGNSFEKELLQPCESKKIGAETAAEKAVQWATAKGGMCMELGIRKHFIFNYFNDFFNSNSGSNSFKCAKNGQGIGIAIL